MNYAEIKYYDIANGEGVRVSLFVSGCRQHCKGCFNEIAWDFSYGHPFTEEVQQNLIEALRPDYIAGLSLLGGDPFEPENCAALLPFLRRVKKEFPDKNIWCYTGYLYRDGTIAQMGESTQAREMVSLLDVLVDGPFILALKDIRLKFRGSSNQRVIDVKRSLESENVVLYLT